MRTLRVVCLLFPKKDSPELLKVAEACLRWTPQVAISDEAVFLEVGRCRGIYEETTLKVRLQFLASRFGTEFRIAFADDASSALALAQWGGSLKSLPIEALSSYLEPFGANPETLKSVHEVVLSLRKLGIASVQEFQGLSPSVLPSRFGKLGLLLYHRVQEAALIPWPRFMPPERVFERIQLESTQPIYDLEPLLFSLKPAVDRAMARLRGRGERALSVRIKLLLERYSGTEQGECHRSWCFDLALPQGSASGLMPIFRERLSVDLGQRPLTAPVTDLEFEVLETSPGVGAQRDFFDTREEETEAWNSLIVRLSEKVGKENVFLAEPVERYLPERAWKKRDEASLVSEAQEPKDRLFLPERPLRLFQMPQVLLKEGGLLGVATSPVRWRVAGAEGPEILSGEWWFRQSQRSYYRIWTDQGEHLWVFQTPGSDTLYLHGYFD